MDVIRTKITSLLLFLPLFSVASTEVHTNYWLYIFVALLSLAAFCYFAYKFTIWVFIRIQNMKQAHRNEKKQRQKKAQ